MPRSFWYIAWLSFLGLATALAAGELTAQDGTQIERGMGYIPTPPELLATVPKTRKYHGFLPASVSLAQHFPPPREQGTQNSCVAWATGYAARGYYSSAVDGLPVTKAENVPSPSYLYDLALSQEGIVDCDKGMKFLAAFQILEGGAVSLAQMPYVESSCTPPVPEIRKLANQFRIKGWRYIEPRNLDTVKGELAKGHPVVFGMMVSDDFRQYRGESVYSGSNKGPIVGGHAMAIVGYDEARQAFRIINSWGQEWGDGGYAWINYGAFLERTHEAWTMLPPDPVPKPQPSPNPEPSPLRPEPKPEPPTPVSTVEDLGLECAKVGLVRENGKEIAKGFVAKPEDLARVQERLKDRAVEIQVDVRPWPQCEALLTLDRALNAEDRPEVMIRSPLKTLKKGDPLVIDVVSPHRPSHLHVAYIQADGSVVHLVQADVNNLRTVDSGQRLSFGDGLEGRQRFVVKAPFGAELVIALASRSPLFPDPRPQSETERDFLTALRKALLWKPDPSAPDRAVSAAMAGIVTTEN